MKSYKGRYTPRAGPKPAPPVPATTSLSAARAPTEVPAGEQGDRDVQGHRGSAIIIAGGQPALERAFPAVRLYTMGGHSSQLAVPWMNQSNRPACQTRWRAVHNNSGTPTSDIPPTVNTSKTKTGGSHLLQLGSVFPGAAQKKHLFQVVQDQPKPETRSSDQEHESGEIHA